MAFVLRVHTAKIAESGFPLRIGDKKMGVNGHPKAPQNPTTDNRLKTYKTMYKNRITYVII
jgi:hypothetical protein